MSGEVLIRGCVCLVGVNRYWRRPGSAGSEEEGVRVVRVAQREMTLSPDYDSIIRRLIPCGSKKKD